MKRLLALAFLLACSWSLAQDRTDSPYFLVQGSPGTDLLPLKHTEFQATITGVIADVTVTQFYRNEGKSTLEAVYVFPASSRAAVYALSMTIGERRLEAEIRERNEARAEYDAAKAAGQSAALLEQERPNVFRMNVANILPSDEIKVELRYTELLVPDAGVYEFVYPTVVGPRYSAGGETWNANPYTPEDEAPFYTFGAQITLSAGLPIDGLESPSHALDIAYAGPAYATATLAESEVRGGNRDFILRYRLAGDTIRSGLLLFEGEEENFFLLTAQPPERVQTEMIPARDYLFVLDVSGSMNGFPLEITKALMRELLTRLRPTDRFNVLLFAGSSSVLSKTPLSVTEESIRQALFAIDNLQGGGGTELLSALQQALAMPSEGGTSRTVLVVTDGYVTVEPEVFDLIRDNLGEANIFTFGTGTSVNRFLLEGMARVGQGEPFVATTPEEAQELGEKLFRTIETPVMTNIQVSFDGFDVYDSEPLALPDLFAERPILVFGKWRGQPQGTVRLTGSTPQGSFLASFDVAGIRPLAEHAALRYLWARNRVMLLSDYQALAADQERAQLITELGLTYNLLTEYTSFVAVDYLVRADGTVETVRQPLPLPQGVSDLAVGDATRLAQPAAPSPAGAMTAEMEGDAAYGITLAQLSVSGDLLPEVADALVRRNLGSLQECGISGPLTLRVDVDDAGGVMLESAPELPGEMLTCLRETLEGWKFPASGVLVLKLGSS